MTFDMNRIWSQALVMVRANWQVLALIGGIFFLLPNLVVVVAMPDLMAQLQVPVATPEELIERLTPLAPTLAAMGLVTMLLSTLGYAAMIRLLAPDRPTVAEALRAAAAAMPTLVGCLLVAMLGYLAFALLGGIVVALLVLGLSFVIGQAGASVIGIGMLLGLLVWFAVRFVLVTPVVMLERTGNPVAAFVRSWKLTRAGHRRLFAFLALLLLPYLVLSTLISNVADVGGSMFASALISGLVGLAFTVLITAILVALHRQLAGDAAGSAEVFN